MSFFFFRSSSSTASWIKTDQPRIFFIKEASSWNTSPCPGGQEPTAAWANSTPSTPSGSECLQDALTDKVCRDFVWVSSPPVGGAVKTIKCIDNTILYSLIGQNVFFYISSCSTADIFFTFLFWCRVSFVFVSQVCLPDGHQLWHAAARRTRSDARGRRQSLRAGVAAASGGLELPLQTEGNALRRRTNTGGVFFVHFNRCTLSLFLRHYLYLMCKLWLCIIYELM